MLEVFINFICALIMSFAGFYIIKKITDYQTKLNIRNIVILLINGISIVIIHYLDYNAISVLLNFIVNTITYKTIFKINIEDAIIITGILSLLIIVADIVEVLIQIKFIPAEILNTSIFYLLGNITVALIAIGFISVKFIRKNLNSFFKILSSKNLRLNSIFIVLIMIAISGVVYSVMINYRYNIRFFSDMLVMISLVFISVIFVRNRDSYNKLSRDYDILMENVQNFEEWIEKEQFNRHEYKNQLAVLYTLTTEQKVKEKIQEIINQNMEIENDMIHSLKRIPKGGLKGILYYKIIIAQKYKINLTIDVSVKEKGILQKLNSNKINELAKVTGIYFDNAIEAAKESRKKIISLEIYELKDYVNIIISNTFSNKHIIDNNSKKGVSSKGKGRGNGLYFASKIVNNNVWLREKHEILDNYYIETITIQKNTSK